jgi:hypothetical protein
MVVVTVALLATGGGAYLWNVTQEIKHGQVGGHRFEAIQEGVKESFQSWLRGTETPAQAKSSAGISTGPLTPDEIKLTFKEAQQLRKLRDRLVLKHQGEVRQLLVKQRFGTRSTERVELSKEAKERLWFRVKTDPDSRPLLDAKGEWLKLPNAYGELETSWKAIDALDDDELVRVLTRQSKNDLVNVGEARVKFDPFSGQADEKLKLRGTGVGNSKIDFFERPVQPQDFHLYGRNTSTTYASIEDLTEKAFRMHREISTSRAQIGHLKKKGEDLVRYLTGSGRVTDAGRWEGSFFSDIVAGRTKNEQLEALYREFGQSNLSPEFMRKYGVKGDGNFWDYLKNFQQEVTRHNRKDAYALWTNRRGMLGEAARSTDLFRNLQRDTELLNKNEEFLSRLLHDLEGDPVFQNHKEHWVQISDFQDLPRNRYDLDADSFTQHELRSGLSDQRQGSLSAQELANAAQEQRLRTALQRTGVRGQLTLPSRAERMWDPRWLSAHESLPGPVQPGAAGPQRPAIDPESLLDRLVKHGDHTYRVTALASDLQSRNTQVILESTAEAFQIRNPFDFRDSQISHLLQNAQYPEKLANPIELSASAQIKIRNPRTKEVVSHNVLDVLTHLNGNKDLEGYRELLQNVQHPAKLTNPIELSGVTQIGIAHPRTGVVTSHPVMDLLAHLIGDKELPGYRGAGLGAFKPKELGNWLATASLENDLLNDLVSRNDPDELWEHTTNAIIGEFGDQRRARAYEGKRLDQIVTGLQKRLPSRIKRSLRSDNQTIQNGGEVLSLDAPITDDGKLTGYDRHGTDDVSELIMQQEMEAHSMLLDDLQKSQVDEFSVSVQKLPWEHLREEVETGGFPAKKGDLVAPEWEGRFQKIISEYLNLYQEKGAEAVPKSMREGISLVDGQAALRVPLASEGESAYVFADGRMRHVKDKQRVGGLASTLDRTLKVGLEEIGAANAPGKLGEPDKRFQAFDKLEATAAVAAKAREGLDGKAAYQNALHGAVRFGDADIGLYRSQGPKGQLLGFQVPEGANWEQIRKNTSALVDPSTQSYVGFDLETFTEKFEESKKRMDYLKTQGREVVEDEVHNLAMVRFERGQDGFRARKTLHIATEWSQKADAVRKAGGMIVDSEQKLLDQARRFLFDHQEEIVGGHNIAFDIKTLTDRLVANGLNPALAKKAMSRAADTLLLTHAALPDHKGGFGLEYLAQSHLSYGTKFKEAHEALSDTLLANSLTNSFQSPEYRERVKNSLAMSKQLALKAGDATQAQVSGTILWNNSTRRAYEFLGVLDPQKAAEALTEIGREAETVYGFAARKIDFTDPTRASMDPADVRVVSKRTPTNLAKAVAGSWEVLATPEIAAERMEEAARDMARNRLRLRLNGKNSFGQLLSESWRYGLISGQLSEDQLIEKFNSFDTTADKQEVRRAADWFQNYGSDTRIQRQVQLEQTFWEQELPHHQPIVDMLSQHVAQGGSTEEASAVWNRYQKTVSDWKPMPTILDQEVPLKQRQISVKVPILGNNSVALRVGSREMLEADLLQHSASIAKKLGLPDVFESMRDPTNLAEFAEGRPYLEKAWKEHLQPALAEGGFAQAGGSAQERITIDALDQHSAVQELLGKGQQAAQRIIKSMEDPLQARAYTEAEQRTLQVLQSTFLKDGVAGSIERGTRNALVLHSGHQVPSTMENRTIEDLLKDAKTGAQVTEESQANFVRHLKNATAHMDMVEEQQLRQALKNQAPEWMDQIFQTPKVRTGSYRSKLSILAGMESVTEAAVAATAQTAERAFNPGTAHQLGMDVATKVVDNQSTAKLIGLGALGLMGATLLVAGMTQPKKPKAASDDPDGFRSSPEERAARKQTIQNQIPQSQSVNVRIFADGQGMDPQEISASVNQVLGQHFKAELPNTQAQVQDNRRTFDRSYLDELAASLLTGQS